MFFLPSSLCLLKLPSAEQCLNLEGMLWPLQGKFYSENGRVIFHFTKWACHNFVTNMKFLVTKLKKIVTFVTASVTVSSPVENSSLHNCFLNFYSYFISSPYNVRDFVILLSLSALRTKRTSNGMKCTVPVKFRQIFQLCVRELMFLGTEVSLIGNPTAFCQRNHYQSSCTLANHNRNKKGNEPITGLETTFLEHLPAGQVTFRLHFPG